LFVLLAVWASLQNDLKVRRLTFHGDPASYIFKTVPLGLILMTMLSTGLEASAGAWLATYAKRSGAGVAGIVGMPAFFWFGLLMSRWFWSSGRQTISHDKILRGSVAIVAAAWIAIISLQVHLLAMAIASLCLGFGIGPTYPLLLAWALRFRCGGSIFFLAGVGSAALPWLMGLISGRHHSLRVGLLVPILGSAWMVGSSIVLPLSRWDKANVTLVSVS
jgi:fucose permease